MSDLSAGRAAFAATGNNALAGQLLEAMAVPAWLHCPGQPLQANAALRRLCGLQAGSGTPQDPLELLVPADRDALARASDECLWRSGEPPAQPARLLGADGSQRPVELSLRRLLLDGAPAMLVTCQDLSDMQHVQTMLQGMGSLLRQIIDGAPVASFVIDRFHRVTHWNTACSRLTGCAAEQMIGSTEAWRAFYDQPRPLLADLIVDGVGEDRLAALHGASARGSALVAGAYEAEAFFPRFGPEGRWLGFTAAPLRDEHGQVVGAIVTLQDVSQRRRTEADLTRQLEQMVQARSAELAASARVMDAFIDNAPIGVVYARRARVLRSNRQMAQIFGPPGPGSVGHGFHLSPDDRETILRATRPALARGQTVHHELWLRHASGRAIWVQLQAFTVDHAARDSGTWWMLQDRSEMRAAQEELRQRFDQLQQTNQQLAQAQNQLLQSDKMASIGQLAAGVAHEINNPVGFVSSNLHTLRQYVASLLQLVDAYGRCSQPATPEAAQQLAQTLATVELDYLKDELPQLLDESADGLARVKKIVQDLKDFSRVDQADWQLADLNAGLESTLNVVRHELKYKAQIVRRLAPLPLVHCLAGQLNQVFMNLIVNASQAISGQGVITLASGTQDGWVWVQVDDSGAGMPEAVQRRIFEPFYTTKAVGQGTGLGLSLSFSIVQRHGGLIQVRSQPGVGSQFRVWVPVAGPAPAAVAPAPPPAWD
ncbi:MAG: ATP-binding protein [Pseudomonadota bacterium]